MAAAQETRPASTSSPITIHFARKGVLPPVYLAADFTEPPWEPIEMEFEADQSSDSAHFNFSKTFPMIKPGEHQYKFRLGPGEEGWTVDDDVNMAVDKAGHENNWVFVKSSEPLRHPELPDPTAPIPLTSNSHDIAPLNADPVVLPNSSPRIGLDTSPTLVPQNPPSSQETRTPSPNVSGASQPGAMENDKALTISDVNGSTNKTSFIPESSKVESLPKAKVDTMPVNISQPDHDDKVMTQASSEAPATQGTEVDQGISPSRDSVVSAGGSTGASVTEDGIGIPRWTVLLRDDVPSDLSTDAVMHAQRSSRSAETRHDMRASMVNQYWDQETGTLLPIERAQMVARTRSPVLSPESTCVATQDPNVHSDLAVEASGIRTTPKSTRSHKAKHRHNSGDVVSFPDRAICGLRRDALLLLATATLCAILAVALYLLQDDDVTIV